MGMTDERKNAETDAQHVSSEKKHEQASEYEVEAGEVVEEELVEGAPVRRKKIEWTGLN